MFAPPVLAGLEDLALAELGAIDAEDPALVPSEELEDAAELVVATNVDPAAGAEDNTQAIDDVEPEPAAPT